LNAPSGNNWTVRFTTSYGRVFRYLRIPPQAVIWVFLHYQPQFETWHNRPRTDLTPSRRVTHNHTNMFWRPCCQVRN
jgi:hypothetical protein